MASRSDPNKPRALLTGYTGFTGRYVARELTAAGYEVVGLAHDGAAEDTALLHANLLDRSAISAAIETAHADVVIHLAAIAFVAHGDVDELYRVNIVGTRNLLAALASAAYRPRAVVLASSANVYGNAQDDPITEITRPLPSNDYAVSKLAMEQMAGLWMGELPIMITRPFNYTGVGQAENFIIPKIVAHFRRGERVIELGNTSVWRDFSDVRDIARIYARIADQPPLGKTLNLCSGAAHSLDEVLDMMAEIAGYRIDVRINPAFVRNNEVERLLGSNRRLRNELGELSLTSFNETLAWMYKSPRAQG